MKMLSLILLVVVVAQHAYGQTGWQLSRLDSPMGDSAGIVLTAKQLPLGSAEASSEETSMAIQCSTKKKLEVVLSTALILRESGNVSDRAQKGSLGGLFSGHGNATLSRVRIRFDQQKVRTEEWMLGANPSNLFAQKPKQFVDALLKDQVQDLLLEAHPLGGDPVVFRFDVRGLAQYKTNLHDACGY
jgi:hypothetical protein